MKELPIEEKATRYDQAIEELRGLLDGVHEEKCDIMEEDIIKIFPELKESEDERIRKELLQIAKESEDSFYMVMTPNKRKTLIAWLEKQCEHANFRNKIQIGDKVTRNEDGVLVNLSKLKRVAKPAEEQGEQKQELLTKEKALKNSPFVEQKSAEWSEDDQSNFCELRSFIVETYRAEDASKLITWLESLKDRVQPQPKQEWSEEDEQTFIKSVEALEDFGKFELADWLKEHKNQFLKPQNTWKPSDEQMVALEHFIVYHNGSTNYAKDLEELRLQLKKMREE